MKTIHGSKVEPLAVPDEDGWIKVRRVEDSATREWHVSQIVAETDGEQDFLAGKTRMLRGAI